MEGTTQMQHLSLGHRFATSTLKQLAVPCSQVLRLFNSQADRLNMCRCVLDVPLQITRLYFVPEVRQLWQ